MDSVYCPECGWEGTVSESLKNNSNDDECPECGNTKLEYTIGDDDDKI